MWSFTPHPSSISTLKQLNGSPVSQELQTTKTNIDTSLFNLFQARLDLGYLMRSSEVLAEQVVSTLVEEELSRWRLRQQLACIGAPQDSSLHKLQTWYCTAL
ncbi:hypothetical protein CRUP_021010 [Coryphaenoides rupestris]|nr:hypothetical protein CRUP_021010 [Coryphaenoides rupestris]